ncbi:hypothetical protein EYC84_001183 [Monilinia fructicola]|uniref:Uncharacterized protein n=1 Tax=Monilinia fructicola TaxID=38448 RepID=A0A5M9JLM9_MONFR|nr:hypothetical protein EYC84_001183 [Monilinia fructicola]
MSVNLAISALSDITARCFLHIACPSIKPNNQVQFHPQTHAKQYPLPQKIPIPSIRISIMSLEEPLKSKMRKKTSKKQPNRTRGSHYHIHPSFHQPNTNHSHHPYLSKQTCAQNANTIAINPLNSQISEHGIKDLDAKEVDSIRRRKKKHRHRIICISKCKRRILAGIIKRPSISNSEKQSNVTANPRNHHRK